MGCLQPVVALRAMPGTLCPSALAWLRHASPEGRTIADVKWGVSSPSSPFGLCRARFALRSCVAAPRVARRAKRGGARRDRTADLVIANDALSQLSYGPIANASTLTTSADDRRHLQSAPRSSQERRKRRFGGICPEPPLFARVLTGI